MPVGANLWRAGSERRTSGFDPRLRLSPNAAGLWESHWEPAACLDKGDQSPKRTNAVQVPPPRGGARRGSYISQGIFELTQRQGLMTPFLAPFHLLLFPSGHCVFLREPNL